MSNLLVERAYGFSNIHEESSYTVEVMKNAGWISAIITVLVLWHHGGMLQSPEEMQNMIFDMFHVNAEDFV